MKLTIFGATGGTGCQIVRQAVHAGHEVTAVVRDANRLPPDLSDLVAVVEADPLDDTAAKAAVSARDAVISAIGPRDLKQPTHVCTETAGILTAAIRSGSHRQPRLVLASNSAMAPGPGDD